MAGSFACLSDTKAAARRPASAGVKVPKARLDKNDLVATRWERLEKVVRSTMVFTLMRV
jgi:hypothetical protein